MPQKNTENIITVGWSPVLSPIILGVKTYPSRHCTAQNMLNDTVANSQPPPSCKIETGIIVPSPIIVPRYGIKFNIPAKKPSKKPNFTPATQSPNPSKSPIIKAIRSCPRKNATIISVNLRTKNMISSRFDSDKKPMRERLLSSFA